jgi:hypothetical protein
MTTVVGVFYFSTKMSRTRNAVPTNRRFLLRSRVQLLNWRDFNGAGAKEVLAESSQNVLRLSTGTIS